MESIFLDVPVLVKTGEMNNELTGGQRRSPRRSGARGGSDSLSPVPAQGELPASQAPNSEVQNARVLADAASNSYSGAAGGGATGASPQISEVSTLAALLEELLVKSETDRAKSETARAAQDLHIAALVGTVQGFQDSLLQISERLEQVVKNSKDSEEREGKKGAGILLAPRTPGLDPLLNFDILKAQAQAKQVRLTYQRQARIRTRRNVLRARQLLEIRRRRTSARTKQDGLRRPIPHSLSDSNHVYDPGGAAEAIRASDSSGNAEEPTFLSRRDNDDPLLRYIFGMIAPEGLTRPQQLIVPEADNPREIEAAGFLDSSTVQIVFKTALCDTGATANFVSKDFVTRNLEALRPHLRSSNRWVTLGDGVTKCKIHASLVIDVAVPSLDDPTLEHKASSVEFLVLDNDRDVVFGLPLLLRDLSDYLVDRIQRYVKRNSPEDPEKFYEGFRHLSWLALSLADPDPEAPLLQPWSTILEDAPEDLETPEPSTCKDHLRYLAVGRDKLVEEYKELYGEHVHGPFLDTFGVRDTLDTVGCDVFVPKNWDGVDYPDLELNFLPGMPERLKPPPRPVNKKLYEPCKEEAHRLLDYMYQKSDSPVASPLVVAPKATKPFIRLCGDYRVINKYLLAAHVPIPDVKKELEKIKQFKVMLDMDLVNAFHQRRLSPKSRQMLSIQTPWFQMEPKFMPEGISVGSGELQRMMRDIFSDFDDWSIIMFDNVLLLAHDYDDAHEKLKKFLTRCKERNIFLKFSKSWLGFNSVNFFGYKCDNSGWELDENRKKALLEVAMPNSKKGMQSFLGMTVFFSEFVENYSTHRSLLDDMTKEGFNWNKATWLKDYDAAFSNMKEQCANSLKLHFPDYDVPCTLRTDASEVGIGSVLFQTVTLPDGTTSNQPLGFSSHKFSGPATRWSTIEQEAYATYHAVKHFGYYLIGKSFILETDHANLQWMEASEVPKIQRWRIYMQSYSFLIRHIAGRLNQVADQLSRLLSPRDGVDSAPQVLCRPCNSSQADDQDLDLLRAYLHDELHEQTEELRDADMRAHVSQLALDDLLSRDETTADPRQLYRQVQHRLAPMRMRRRGDEGDDDDEDEDQNDLREQQRQRRQAWHEPWQQIDLNLGRGARRQRPVQEAVAGQAPPQEAGEPDQEDYDEPDFPEEPEPEEEEGEGGQGVMAAQPQPELDHMPSPEARQSIRVAAALYDRTEGKFLIGQLEHDAHRPALWQLPVASLNQGQTCKQAAAAALRSHTGADIRRPEDTRLVRINEPFFERQLWLLVAPLEACELIPGDFLYDHGRKRWTTLQDLLGLEQRLLDPQGAIAEVRNQLAEQVDALYEDLNSGYTTICYDHVSEKILVQGSTVDDRFVNRALPSGVFRATGDIPRRIAVRLALDHHLQVSEVNVLPPRVATETRQGNVRTHYLALIDFARAAKWNPELQDGLAAPQGYAWMTLTDFLASEPALLAGDVLFKDHLSEAVQRVYPAPEQILAKVHGGRRAHHGARRTAALLNREFPGHRIPLSFIENYVTQCAVCQKVRLHMTMGIKPAIKHIKPDTHRSSIGVDTLTIANEGDRHGNKYIVVVTNLWSKHSRLFPTKDRSAETIASCLYQYFTTFGLVDRIASDPGSEFDNNVVSSLERWLGVSHLFSLIGRHESNGVERTNRKVLDYLRALELDERIRNRWSDPTILCWVEYELNTQINVETSFAPWQLLFGTGEAAYFKLPENDGELAPDYHGYVRQLDADLQLVRLVSREYQARLALERVEARLPIQLNRFDNGEFVLRQVPADKRGVKLAPYYRGPYEVLSSRGDDYTCRHLSKEANEVLHVSQLELFTSNALTPEFKRAEAVQVAQADFDEFFIEEIISYKGNPNKRSTVQFLCRWRDEEELWRGYGADLAATDAYRRFLEKFPETKALAFATAEEAARAQRSMQRQGPTAHMLNQAVYVPLRSYGWPDDNGWYDERLPNLPNRVTARYYVRGQLGRAIKRNAKGRLDGVKLTVPVFNMENYMDGWDVHQACLPYLPEGAILIDAAWIRDYPELLGN